MCIHKYGTLVIKADFLNLKEWHNQHYHTKPRPSPHLDMIKNWDLIRQFLQIVVNQQEIINSFLNHQTFQEKTKNEKLKVVKDQTQGQ